ncbi:MAG: head GIN domain-containing protein [Saprospiraceae bacterium]
MALAAILLALSSCCIDDDGFFGHDCEDGFGPEVEVVLNMPQFHSIVLKNNIDVNISQGNFFKVVAVGEENIIELLELDVQNGVWDIEFERCVGEHDVKLFITTPDIRLLSIQGSGDIFAETFLETQDLTLRISGSGDMCLGAFAETVDAKITGSGDIELEGNAQDLDLRISGSGDFKAFPFITQHADVRISGSGDASVHVLELLEVNISGSGNVYFKGNPQLVIDITGSGDVIDAN